MIDSTTSYQCSQNLLFDYDVFFLGFFPKGLLTQNHTKCFTKNTKDGFSRQLYVFSTSHSREMEAFLIIIMPLFHFFNDHVQH